MKSVILIHLITLVVLSHTKEEFSEISDECVTEIMEHTIAAERCMDERVGTPVDILNRLNSIVFNYHHSDDDFVNLIEFASKNCAHMPQVLQCLQMVFRHSAECARPNRERNNIKKLFFSGIDRITNYICANNFNVIKRLIPNDGLRFLLLNDDFDKCFENVADRNIDHTGQICPLIDIAAPCVLEVIGDHPNENVYIVAHEIIEDFRTVANCSNF